MKKTHREEDEKEPIEKKRKRKEIQRVRNVHQRPNYWGAILSSSGNAAADLFNLCTF